mgnify:CR=1 FL=1
MRLLNQADGERMAFIQPRAQGCLCDVSVYSPVLQQVFDRDQQKSAVPGLPLSALRKRLYPSEAQQSELRTARACHALGVFQATFYRHLKPPASQSGRPSPPLALRDEERKTVLDLLHTERFHDDGPRQVFADLLDEGQDHCSVRTMYRILEEEHGVVKERRRHVHRPAYKRPERLATRANFWSWDIKKLLGPVKWTYDLRHHGHFEPLRAII